MTARTGIGVQYPGEDFSILVDNPLPGIRRFVKLTSVTSLTAPELKRLHAAYADGVFRFFWASTGRVCDAEDLVQEFFVKLARHGAGVLLATNERAWIFATARNLAIDWHRREARLAVSSYEEGPHQLEFKDTNEDPDAAYLARELSAALARLPEEQRTAAQMRLWENLSLQEIAEIQNVPLQTAASRIRYALKALRTQLQSLYSEFQ